MTGLSKLSTCKKSHGTGLIKHNNLFIRISRQLAVKPMGLMQTINKLSFRLTECRKILFLQICYYKIHFNWTTLECNVYTMDKNPWIPMTLFEIESSKSSQMGENSQQIFLSKAANLILRG